MSCLSVVLGDCQSMGFGNLVICRRRSLASLLLCCCLIGLSHGLPAENAISLESPFIVTQLPVRHSDELRRARTVLEQHKPLAHWLPWPGFADGAQVG